MKNCLFISALLLLVSISSCTEKIEPDNSFSDNSREVSIMLAGDYLDITTSPLTKGETNEAYFAFEVDSLHIVEYQEYFGGVEYSFKDTTYCHYAEGVFDNPNSDNLKITLKNGTKYRIRCSIVVNREESLYVNNDCIQEPFASSVYGYGSKCRITNTFSYAPEQTVYAYNPMNVVRVVSDNSLGTNKWNAMVDRYYGEVETDGMTAIKINLTRRNFGLHFYLVPPKKGELKVYMDYGTPKFSFTLSPSSERVDEEHIYSLDLINDFANMYLRVFWTDEDGVSYDLSPEKFKVYNKTMTNISVDINDRIAPSGF